MRQLTGFIRKEFIHIFRDKRTLVVLFGMPVIQLLLFGYVITNEIKDASVAILDRSKSDLSQKLVAKILSSGYFKLDYILDSEKGIHQAFREGKVKVVFVIDAGFGKNLAEGSKAKLQIIADASDPNTANILVNYSKAIINDFYRSTLPNEETLPLIIPEVRLLYNPEMTSSYMFVPGIIAMLLMLISALLTSISLTREKELGTMEVLLSSPLNPFVVISGKVIPYLLLSFADACLIIFIGNLVFGVPVNGSLALLLAETSLFILLALSVGILVSTITSSQQTAMMVSMVVLMLPTILLSGFVFPVENMPLILQYLCKIMPPKYFITIVRSIMLKGSGLAELWAETSVLAGMTIFFLLVSIKKYKKRLE